MKDSQHIRIHQNVTAMFGVITLCTICDASAEPKRSPNLDQAQARIEHKCADYSSAQIQAVRELIVEQLQSGESRGGAMKRVREWIAGRDDLQNPFQHCAAAVLAVEIIPFDLEAARFAARAERAEHESWFSLPVEVREWVINWRKKKGERIRGLQRSIPALRAANNRAAKSFRESMRGYRGKGPVYVDTHYSSREAEQELRRLIQDSEPYFIQGKWTDFEVGDVAVTSTPLKIAVRIGPDTALTRMPSGGSGRVCIENIDRTRMQYQGKIPPGVFIRIGTYEDIMGTLMPSFRHLRISVEELWRIPVPPSVLAEIE